jgi:beta-lactamase regulating signal transducer with metallopeptidase domain
MLIQICLRRLTPSLRHLLWLFILFSVMLLPLSFFIIPPGIFRIGIGTDSPSESLRILGTVLPRYDALGNQIESVSGVANVATPTHSPGLHIPLAIICLIVWIMGIFFVISRLICGIIGIERICKGAETIENNEINIALVYLLHEFDIRRKVQVLTASACRVPFTYGSFKPSILLPTDALQWPRERLRSVMIHELAHVKRFDSCTQLFARVMCALFWFIPLVWIAYRFLYMEQEKSCDQYAVGTGIEATRYARDILNVVRFARGRVLVTGIFISRGRKKMLEKRILHLLRPSALLFLSKKMVFVATALLGLLLLVPVLVFNPMFADDIKDDAMKMISENELWNTVSGTWVNKEYTGIRRFEQKVIVYPDGKFECYPKLNDTNPSRLDYYHRITKSWIDSEGVIWYNFIDYIKAADSPDLMKTYGLGMINESRSRWEYIMGHQSYPTEIDTTSSRYVYNHYHRQ